MQLILVVPQPLYFITVEFMKLSSEYYMLYYPNQWAIVYQILLILSLYIPTICLYFLVREQIDDCVRQVHPFYDFETNRLFSKKPVSQLQGSSLSPISNENLPLMDRLSDDVDDNVTISQNIKESQAVLNNLNR